MNIRPEFVLGKQKNNDWSGVYGYRPDEELSQISLYAAMRLSSNSEELELERVANLLLDELQQSFFDKKEDDTMQRLENAIWKMKSRMDMILSREDKIVESGIDIEMVATVIDKDFLYAGIIGESKLFIERGENFADISNGLIDRNMMGFLKSGSLKLEQNDRICVCTSKCFEGNEYKIQDAMRNLDMAKLDSLTEIYGAALLLLADENLDWKESANELEPSVVEDLPESEVEDYNPKPDKKDTFQELEKEERVEENMDAIEAKEMENDNEADDYDNSLKENPLNKAKEGLMKFGVGLGSKLKNIRNPKVEDEEYTPAEYDYGDNEYEEDADEDEMQEKVNEYEFKPDYVRENADYKAKVMAGLSAVLALGKRIVSAAKNLWDKRLSRIFKDNNKTYAKFLRDVGNAISNFFRNLWLIFKREIIGTGDRRDVYRQASRRKRNRIILLVLIIIIGIILFNAYNNRQAAIKEQERQDTALTKKNAIQSELDSVKNQIATNQNPDPTEKTTYITSLDNITNEAEDAKDSNLYVDDLNKIEADAAQVKDNLLNIVGFSDAQIVSDVGKLYSDANLSDIVYSNGNIYASDTGRNVVYQITPNLNSQPTTFATGLTSPSLLIRNVAGDIIVYDKDPSSEVGTISIKDGKVARFPGLSDGIIGKVDGAAMYNGNEALYEIHQNHQQIFKRLKLGNSYAGEGALYVTANPPNWKSDGDLAEAVDIAVPYEVYVLINGKGLERFLAGGDNSITNDTYKNISDDDIKAIGKATCFDISGKYLAIGDPVNQRVLLFTIDDSAQKNLIFQKQYVYRGKDDIFKNIKELAINDANGSIYVLDGSKVERLDL